MKISHLLFGLDNTLYPSSSQMDAGITRRMLECVAEYFKCDFETAVELRKKNIIHFSTTLEWLRAEGFTDIRDAKLLGKPYPHSYSVALRKSGTNLEDTLFFDDMQKYTDGWTAMGGTAILIGDKNGRPLSDDAESLSLARKINSGRDGKTIRLKSIYDFPSIIDTLKD